MFFNSLINDILAVMKRVLVTGSNGLLGQKITQQILRRPEVELIATNRGKNKYPVEEGYVYETMDILDKDQMAIILERHRPDVVIHTAAITNVDVCHANHETCWETNVDATATLISLCEKMGIHFIYVSTDFVFDGLNGPCLLYTSPSPRD